MKRPAFLPALLALALMTTTGMAQGQRGPGRRTAPSSPPTTRVRGGSQGSPATVPRAIPGLPPPSKEAIAAAAEAEEPIAGPGLLLNFQGASLSEVLTYLSETAGFVIVQETPVQGTINLTSRQPLTPEEAIDTLNSVLIDKGYTAVRNGRVLKIISSRDALKHGDTRVFTGNQPEQIPRKDNIVTQIIPIRYGEAAKLVENLRPLLPEGSSIGANDSSNAILLTDTQANIRRIVQIVQALDTSVANISTITVFPLNFADAKQVATTITQLYAIPAGNNQQGNQGGRGGRGGRGGGGGGGGGPGGGGGFPGFGGGGLDGPGGGRGGSQGAAQSEAREAASRVVAVSDEQSNSVIVSCAEDLVPGIRAMIQEIDVSITADSETRFFRLENADATELAATISKLYSDTGTTTAGNNQGGQPGFGFPFGGQPQSTSTTKSTRALRQAQVNAVGDPRTNVLLITASHESMTDIAGMIGQLDATPAKKQRVYTYAMRHGDPGTLADVLRGILGQPTTKQQIDRLNDRQNAGAAISTDLSGGLGGSQGGGGGGGGGGGR